LGSQHQAPVTDQPAVALFSQSDAVQPAHPQAFEPRRNDKLAFVRLCQVALRSDEEAGIWAHKISREPARRLLSREGLPRGAPIFRGKGARGVGPRSLTDNDPFFLREELDHSDSRKGWLRRSFLLDVMCCGRLASRGTLRAR